VAFDWMTQGQLLSLPMIALGLYLLVRKAPIKG
jgi:prolipoprotein diacylglyceryltransferase